MIPTQEPAPSAPAGGPTRDHAVTEALVRLGAVGAVVLLLHALGAFSGVDRSAAAIGALARPAPARALQPLLLEIDPRSVERWGPPPWSPRSWSEVAAGLESQGIAEAWVVDPWPRVVDAEGPVSAAPPGAVLRVPRVLVPGDHQSLPTEHRLTRPMGELVDAGAMLWLPPHSDGVVRDVSRASRAGDLFGRSILCDWTPRCPSGGALALPLRPLDDLPRLSLRDVVEGRALAPSEVERLVLIGLTAHPWAERTRVGVAGSEATWPEAVAASVAMSRSRSPALSIGWLGESALILAALVAAGMFEASERRLRAELRLVVLPLVAFTQALLFTTLGWVQMPVGAMTLAAAAPPFLTALAGRRVALSVLRKAALLVAQDAWDSGWRTAQVRSAQELGLRLASLARNQTRSQRSALLVRDGSGMAVHGAWGVPWRTSPPVVPEPLLRAAIRSPRGAAADGLVSEGHARLFAVRSGRHVAGWWVVAWAPHEPEPDPAVLGRLATRLSRNLALDDPRSTRNLHERLVDHVAAETASVRDLLVLASEERRRQVQTLHAVELPVLTADLTGQALFVNRALSTILEETDLGPVRSVRELVFRIRGDTGLDEAMRALFLGLEPLRIPWLDPMGRLWRVAIQPVTAPEPGDERAVLGFVVSFVDRTDTVRLDDLRESVVEFSSARVRDALTVIIGYAGLARERLDDPSTRVMMDTVHERAVQVSRALEDLKAVGQLAATDHLSITVDARRLIEEVLAEVETIADERDVALRSFVPEIGLPVRVVPDDARDALSALLREATATAPPGSEVVLRLDQDHQGSVIRVEWSGPGIDPLVREHCVGEWHLHPERLPEVLRPFARVRRSFPYLDLDGAPGGGVSVSLAMHHAVEAAT